MYNKRNELNVFISAFKNRFGKTPNEYIARKISTGSHIDDIKYLFNIIAVEIADKNQCKYFDFDNFYRS